MKSYINNPSGFPLENVRIKKVLSKEVSERLRRLKEKTSDDLKEVSETNFMEMLVEKAINKEEHNTI